MVKSISDSVDNHIPVTLPQFNLSFFPTQNLSELLDRLQPINGQNNFRSLFNRVSNPFSGKVVMDLAKILLAMNQKQDYPPKGNLTLQGLTSSIRLVVNDHWPHPERWEGHPHVLKQTNMK